MCMRGSGPDRRPDPLCALSGVLRKGFTVAIDSRFLSSFRDARVEACI